MRAAVYARFSSDLQDERSITDQLALCRAYADRRELIVVEVYDDRAISGASTVQRLGWQRLMADAGARKFDVVIAEDVDRIARDEADWHAAKRRLTFLGIAIHAAHTGPVSGIEGSVRAMMAAHYLENLAQHVHRGMAGVIRDGRHAGGRAYAYRPIAGKPGELVVVEAEAEIVRRIFRDYIAGTAPRDIAGALNREAVPAPRGARWNASTINGSRQRGNGILHNPLYVGRLVWNRTRMIKDPDTGRRVSRVNPESEWQTVAAPHLAIVDQDTFDAVAGRANKVRQVSNRQRPKHLLSGVLRCGSCGSGMSVKDRDKTGKTRIRCSRVHESGACSHDRIYYLEPIERRVLDGLRAELLDPAMIREYVATYQAERKELARAARRDRGQAETKLGETRRAIERLVDALANGSAPVAAVSERLRALEADRLSIEAELSSQPEPAVVAIHPAAVQRYLTQVDKLSAVLRSHRDNLGEAADALRELVTEVIVHPTEPRKPLDIEVVGLLAALLEEPGFPPNRRLSGSVVVAEEGFEPPTHGL